MIFKRHWHQVWGAITLFGLLAWDPFGWMRASAYWVEDTYQKWMPIELPSSPVPVWFVEIDEAALVAYGQWPWPRTDLAEALIGLYERGASAVAIDVIQAEPDRTSPTRLASALGESVETLANEYGYLDWDEFLADVLKQTPTVLALAVLNDNHRTPNSKSAWAHIGPTPSIHNHSGSAGPIPVLADAAAGIGHVSISPDADGLVRRIPVLTQSNNQWFLALGAELIRVASGISTSATKVDELGLHTLKLGPYEIQSDPQGQARLAYSALDGVQRIGLVQALAEDGPDLSGALVVLGPSALGLKDFHDTPVGLSTPGPMFHAALMQQILTDTYVTRPYWSRLAEWSAAALLGLVVLYIALRRSLRDSLLGYVVASGLVLAAGIIAYRTNLWVLDSSFGLIYISLCFALGALSKLLIEESAKRQIRQAFATYLAPSVVDQIADNPKELQLGGETRDLTIMFADLRGFTTLSESYKRDPQALTALVNRVMTPMSDAVINNGGTIDKYLGDCLMAFWNAPVAVEKHPDKAAQAALAIQASLQWLNTRLREDNPDMTPLRVAIGINHGLTVVGNFGSDRRFDYTCLGDPVNLASRLEGLCRYYDVDILVGEPAVTAMDAPQRWTLIPVDRVRVKGKTEPILVHWLAAETQDPVFKRLSITHSQMLEHYWNMEWSNALALLEELAGQAEYPAKLITLYQERIATYRMHPPEPGWDGVFDATFK